MISCIIYSMMRSGENTGWETVTGTPTVNNFSTKSEIIPRKQKIGIGSPVFPGGRKEQKVTYERRTNIKRWSNNRKNRQRKPVIKPTLIDTTRDLTVPEDILYAGIFFHPFCVQFIFVKKA